MNRLSTDKRAQIIGCLVEGMSIRATVRVTGAAKNTITKLLSELGEACDRFQDVTLRDLKCERVQCDEVWSFCYAKQKNVPEKYADQDGYGDVWTWTALCADTKLVPSWLVGDRSTVDAYTFLLDLESRLAHRIQLTTDGHRPYLEAVPSMFGKGVDYAMCIKLFGRDARDDQRKYSPAKCTGMRKEPMLGYPDERHISTSYVERNNLTMRIGMRRFTRLTNGFSKKIENLIAAVNLHLMHYNFARVHQTLGTSPAVAAGVADHVWSLREIVELLDAAPQTEPDIARIAS